MLPAGAAVLAGAGAVRTLAQGQLDLLALVVVEDRHLHPVTRLVRADDPREVVFLDDLLPVDLQDHVPPGAVLGRLEAELLVPALKPRILRRASRDHFGYEPAVGGVEAEL